MVKVITYGTYDLLHYGHTLLLERAKALGDYLIVGITSDDFDKERGKINLQQSLPERMDAVRATGLADEIIIEEFEGQKIDDIKRLDVDIFTVGSDWKGNFDYLIEFCKVVYLDRTEGVSSSQIRSEERNIAIGIVGDAVFLMDKFAYECSYVNGVEVIGICTLNSNLLTDRLRALPDVTKDYSKLLECVDAVYVVTHPDDHDSYIQQALKRGKHVLCETPISVYKDRCKEYFKLATQNGCILMESIKTAYSLAFGRLSLLLKSGIIGEIISVDATCTSLQKKDIFDDNGIRQWGSLYAWGPFAMLPVFSILGCSYVQKTIQTKLIANDYDLFTKISFLYDHAVASVKVGNGVKSEGELIISGTNGYVYVPAPWWKTDYFEVRFENPQDNRRYFYQLEGEGIRYMIVNFIKSITGGKNNNFIPEDISVEISSIMNDFKDKIDTSLI